MNSKVGKVGKVMLDRRLKIFLHIVFWAYMFLSPMQYMRGTGMTMIQYLMNCLSPLLLMIVFYANYMWLTPKYFVQGKHRYYLMINVVMAVSFSVLLHYWMDYTRVLFQPGGLIPRNPDAIDEFFYYVRDLVNFGIFATAATCIALAQRWFWADNARKYAETARVRAEAAPEDATYLIIHIGFYSSTYGDADFLFFSKPFKTQTCVKEIALWPTYGQTDVTHCRFVWGDTRFPDFLPESIDADSLVPGDALEIEYTGELWLLDMGPRIAKIKDGEFVSAKVTHGPVHEVAVNNGVIGQPTGVSLDSMIEKTYAIAQDKALVPMSEVDSGYLVCSALNNEEARVLLTYDPRPDHNS